MVPYFRQAARSPLCVVDYDALMDDARRELTRVAGELRLPLDADARAAVEDYAREFLSVGLRHHRYDEQHLYAHPRVAPLARDAYLGLHRLATGELSLASNAFCQEWDRIEQAHAAMAPILRHIDALETEPRRGLGGVFSWASEFLQKRQDNPVKA